MTHDEKLVEMVAIAIWDGGYRKEWHPDVDTEERNFYRENARAALDAINASGTHRILSVEDMKSRDRCCRCGDVIELNDRVLWKPETNEYICGNCGHI